MHQQQDLSKGIFRLGVVVLGIVAALALSACNTVSGAGQDLQETSDNVKDAIED